MTDTDSGPFFHFPRHRGIAILGDLFLIQSYQPIFTTLGEITAADKVG